MRVKAFDVESPSVGVEGKGNCMQRQLINPVKFGLCAAAMKFEVQLLSSTAES